MADSSPHSRVSRTRRAIALMAWGCLVISAFFLWNARQTGVLTASTNPISASLLAAFGAFVGVFAWMLFNPNQSRSSDSPSLFLAAVATLFPPPLIAFSLISSESPLRWWMALGIFLLVVIGILSHVPDEFFGVPRGRSSYFVPLPLFDRVGDGILDPNASWFTFSDLSEIVSDQQRPSLAPRAYLNEESALQKPGPTTAYAGTRASSEVDDILGTDLDLGLLDDSLMDFELSEFATSDEPTRAPVPLRQPASPTRQDTRSRTPVAHVYSTHNPESLRLMAASQTGTHPARQRPKTNRRHRHSSSLRIDNRRTDRSGEIYQQERASNPVRQEFTEPASIRSQSEPQRSEINQRSQRSELPARTQSPSSTPNANRVSEPTPPAAYLQDTNQRRSDRHRQDQQQTTTQPHQRSSYTDRAAAEARVNQQAGSGTSRKADKRAQQTTDTDNTGRKSAEQQKSRSRKESTDAAAASGASLFGIPMPFSTPSAETNSPTPQSLIDSTSTSTGRRKSRYEERPVEQDFEIPNSSPVIERTPQQAKRENTKNDRSDSAHQTRSTESTSQQPVAQQSFTEPVSRIEASAAEAETETETVKEHLERTRDEHGSELVEGVMKIRFDKGQKRANLHIPFSPPLPGMPDVECECVGDVPLRLKVPVKQSYGIRIEARRSDASEQLETEVGFAAVYTPE